MQKTLFAAAIALLLIGCAAEPQELVQGNNKDVEVYLLTEADGCKIYRFMDSGRFHYFTRCAANENVSTSSVQSCGKNCTESVEVQTINN